VLERRVGALLALRHVLEVVRDFGRVDLANGLFYGKRELRLHSIPEASGVVIPSQGSASSGGCGELGEVRGQLVGVTFFPAGKEFSMVAFEISGIAGRWRGRSRGCG
jgi:hypothetical protein